MNSPFVRSADEPAFYASMLVAEFDLKREDMFSVTLKPEVPRFDHSSMHGADSDLVNFFAVNLEIISVVRHDTWKNHISDSPVPGIVAVAI